MSNRRIVQSKTGDVFEFAWDTDPRGMGGVVLKRWLKHEGESDAQVLARARRDDDEDAWLTVPADVCHDMADGLREMVDQRYMESR